MTSHELANKLLAGPDLPVELQIANAKDTAYTADVSEPKATTADVIAIRGWVNSDDERAYAPWANHGG